MGNLSNAMTSTIFGDLFIKDMAIVLRRINPFIQWCDDGQILTYLSKYAYIHRMITELWWEKNLFAAAFDTFYENGTNYCLHWSFDNKMWFALLRRTGMARPSDTMWFLITFCNWYSYLTYHSSIPHIGFRTSLMKHT